MTILPVASMNPAFYRPHFFLKFSINELAFNFKSTGFSSVCACRCFCGIFNFMYLFILFYFGFFKCQCFTSTLILLL